jgi:hypothetical protein
MTRRYLSSADADFSREKLAAPRARGECLAFHPRAGADLSLSAADTWESVSQKLPEGWQLDFIAVDLWYASNDGYQWLWLAPVPPVVLARQLQRLGTGVRERSLWDLRRVC